MAEKISILIVDDEESVRDSIVIIMTAFASVDTAVQALKDGAFDYVTKPFDPDDLSHLIRNAAAQIALRSENEALRRRVTTLEDIDDLIGLFKVDIFIPILTFIFGQAVFGEQTAITSVYRLRNELYGMKQDNDLLLPRTVKEVIHELGHTFGLIHCHVPTCVMRSSTYVEDIDQKRCNLCVRCRALLEQGDNSISL